MASTSNPSRPGDGLGYGTGYAYDTLGRVTSVTAQDGTSSTTSYLGNATTATDQLGNSRQMNYDAGGRLTSVLEDPGSTNTTPPHLNATTLYSYDPLDDLISVNQSGNVRTFAYDGLKRLTQAVNPESGTINDTYDNAGNLQTKSDPRGVTTTYTYDALNRVTRKSYTGIATPTVSYTYDSGAGYAIGHLTSVVTTGLSSTVYTGFDALGRATQSTQTTLGNTYTLLYGYNLLGGLTSETYPSGRIVEMAHDALNRVTQVSGVKSYIGGIGYAPHGGFQSFAYGNGLQRFEAYNPRLQPAEMVDVPGNGGCGSSSPGPTGKTNWALDLQLFWGQNATQNQSNNGNLDAQLIQTCNGTG